MRFKSIIKLELPCAISQVRNKKIIFRVDSNWGHSALAEICLHKILLLPNPFRLLCSLYRGGNMTQSAKIKYFTHIRSRFLLSGVILDLNMPALISNSLL